MFNINLPQGRSPPAVLFAIEVHQLNHEQAVGDESQAGRDQEYAEDRSRIAEQIVDSEVERAGDPHAGHGNGGHEHLSEQSAESPAHHVQVVGSGKNERHGQEGL